MRQTVTSPPSRAAWIEMNLETDIYRLNASPPSRAAWIEIQRIIKIIFRLRRSPPSRAAWIEIISTEVKHNVTSSPPSRAAWIEIELKKMVKAYNEVAAFTGGVD